MHISHRRPIDLTVYSRLAQDVYLAEDLAPEYYEKDRYHFLKDIISRCIDAATASIIELEAALQAANNRSTELEAALKVANDRSTELEAALQAANNRSTELEAALKVANDRITELEAALQAANDRIAELEAALQVANDRIAELEAALQVANDRIAELEAALKVANDRIAKLEAALIKQRLRVSYGALAVMFILVIIGAIFWKPLVSPSAPTLASPASMLTTARLGVKFGDADAQFGPKSVKKELKPGSTAHMEVIVEDAAGQLIPPTSFTYRWRLFPEDPRYDGHKYSSMDYIVPSSQESDYQIFSITVEKESYSRQLDILVTTP
jgi:ABC-type transporter Mla subunit MlaD